MYIIVLIIDTNCKGKTQTPIAWDIPIIYKLGIDMTHIIYPDSQIGSFY